MSVIRPALLTLPVALHEQNEVDALLRCLVSLAHTAPESQLLVVDDAPVPELSALVAAAAEEVGAAHVVQEEGLGPISGYNVGLEVAKAHGLDAVLIASDLEFRRPGWLESLRSRKDMAGRPAAVVGGRVDAASGLVNHAGYYFSLSSLRWLPRFNGVPAEVREASVPAQCPVGLEFALIRYETLVAAGLLNPDLDATLAQLDYCLRVFGLGLECVCEPAAVALAPRRLVLRTDPAAALIENATLASTHGSHAHLRFIPEVV